MFVHLRIFLQPHSCITHAISFLTWWTAVISAVMLWCDVIGLLVISDESLIMNVSKILDKKGFKKRSLKFSCDISEQHGFFPPSVYQACKTCSLLHKVLRGDVPLVRWLCCWNTQVSHDSWSHEISVCHTQNSPEACSTPRRLWVWSCVSAGKAMIISYVSPHLLWPQQHKQFYSP